MSDEPTCKICGHRGNAHGFADPIACQHCPDHVCQDGERSRRYRETLSDERAASS